MLIFSYGSNMLTSRLEARIGNFNILGKAQISGYDLRFHKRSKDGSGKADLFYTGNEEDECWGIVAEIHIEKKPILDKFEGLGYGYSDQFIEVTINDQKLNALAYLAEPSHIDGSLQPYDWYKSFVLKATIQHNFPTDYIERIKVIVSIQDSNEERRAKNLKILNS